MCVGCVLIRMKNRSSYSEVRTKKSTSNANKSIMCVCFQFRFISVADVPVTDRKKLTPVRIKHRIQFVSRCFFFSCFACCFLFILLVYLCFSSLRSVVMCVRVCVCVRARRRYAKIFRLQHRKLIYQRKKLPPWHKIHRRKISTIVC